MIYEGASRARPTLYYYYMHISVNLESTDVDGIGFHIDAISRNDKRFEHFDVQRYISTSAYPYLFQRYYTANTTSTGKGNIIMEHK